MRNARFVTAFLSVLVAGGLASADTPDGALRIFAASVNPTSDVSGDFGASFDATVEADSATGLGFVYEFRMSDRFGIESGISFAHLDFDVSVAGGSAELGSATMIPLTLGLDVHLLKNTKVDLFVGPLLAYTTWTNLDGPTGTVELDSDFGAGAVLGLDVPVGSGSWTFNSGVRYFTAAAGDATADIDVDPVQAEVGFGRRF